MKRFITLLVALFSLIGSCNLFAQQKKATYIYRNDNVFDAYSCDEIDSITYEVIDGIENQVFWTQTGTERIPVSKIDSVSFNVPQKIIMQIPEEDLNGWEAGYSLGNEYVVAYHDKSNNTLVTFINKNGANEKSGLMLCFNDNNEVISVGTMDKIYDVKYDTNKIVLYRINEESYYEEEVISLPSKAKGNNTAPRTRAANGFWELIRNGIDFIGNIQSGISIGSDFLNWDWPQLVKDGLNTAGGMIIGKNPVAGSVWTIGNWYVDYYRKQDEERKRAAMYGECEISIDDIKPENGSCVVYATVKNANTIYDYLVNMYDRTENEKTRNLVSCGIVVRIGNQCVTVHLHDFESQKTQLNGDVRYGNEAHFSFNIPNLDLTKNLSTYYFRPYLTSTRLQSNKGDVIEGHIKYGEIVPYTAFNGEIKDFKQYDAQYSTDSNNFGFVSFRTSINATINSLDDVEEWGVYVYDLNGSGTYDYYPSEFNAAKLEDWIDVDFNINKDEFDELNHDYFLATKNVKVGVYKKVKNPTGNYDYLSYFRSEPQMCELTYDEKPSLTFTSASLGGTDVYDDEEGNPYYCSTQINANYTATGTFWVNTVDLVVIQGSAQDNIDYWDVMNDGDFPFSVYYKYPYGSGETSAFKFDFVLANGNRVSSTNAIQLSGSPTVTNISIIGNESISSENVRSNSKIKNTKTDFVPKFTLKKIDQ